MKKGIEVLRDKTLNRSVEFTHEEREALGLQGLLPHLVATQQHQVDRVMEILRRKENDIERYIPSEFHAGPERAVVLCGRCGTH
jgi:malate dehydrogenase (oxaloacetate-decarboxylating)(NADP+)